MTEFFFRTVERLLELLNVGNGDVAFGGRDVERALVTGGILVQEGGCADTCVVSTSLESGVSGSTAALALKHSMSV